MREWSVKSVKKRVENPRVVHHVYIRTSLYKAGLVYRQASLVLRTHPLPPYKFNE